MTLTTAVNNTTQNSSDNLLSSHSDNLRSSQQTLETNLAATSWGESALTSASGQVSADDDDNIGSIAVCTHKQSR